ncbi:transmembrane protein, putative [Medicago truncatula]|uniref:Transmembrane protein, putative n=2 Tax=Medicago truncatula TaxID=3880 RepID=A0A072TM07_MEDTR|nr:transmembrane protein, putative [Medicago truncatula]
MAISPPGGVRSVEENNKAQKGNILCANDTRLELCPGEAALAVVYPEHYSDFLYWNTTCFITSLSVLLLLMSGIRLSHRFTMWLLSMGMSFTLTTLLVTYRIAILMVTPDPVYSINEKLLSTVLKIWIGLFSISGLLLTLRILIWTINDYYLNKGEGQSKGNNSTEDSTLLI